MRYRGSNRLIHKVAEPDRRTFQRKRVLFSGVITGLEGKCPIDCTIRDISASGAQTQVSSPLPWPTPVYFVDTWNEAAHRCSIVWLKDGRLGLLFAHSYLLDVGLAPDLQFLRTVLLQAKLGQVRGLIRRGLPVEEASTLVGLSEQYLNQFSDVCRYDGKIVRLLDQARRLLKP